MATGQTATAIATPVSVQALSGRFVENGAATYRINFPLPGGATLLDVIVEGEALWNSAGAATLDVGDTTDPDGWITALNLKASDLLAGESISLGSTQTRGGNAGAYTVIGTSTHLQRNYSAAGRTITASVTVASGVGTLGRTRVTVLYSTGSAVSVTAV
jgi:hypothetical protein